MGEEKLLTVRDVSAILAISEKEVIDLAEDGKIPAYKVGGLYLRFKREQVDEFRKTIKISHPHKKAEPVKYSAKDRIRDFFYFNDFYVVSLLIIVGMLFIIFRG